MFTVSIIVTRLPFSRDFSILLFSECLVFDIDHSLLVAIDQSSRFLSQKV